MQDDGGEDDKDAMVDEIDPDKQELQTNVHGDDRGKGFA